MQLIDQQSIKQLIKAAKTDPDPVSCFGFGGTRENPEGAIFVVKDRKRAELIFKWLEAQGLITINPINQSGSS
jgi:hypothetical protein